MSDKEGQQGFHEALVDGYIEVCEGITLPWEPIMRHLAQSLDEALIRIDALERREQKGKP